MNLQKDQQFLWVFYFLFKNNIEAKEMGDILTNIEDYAKKCVFNVFGRFFQVRYKLELPIVL